MLTDVNIDAVKIQYCRLFVGIKLINKKAVKYF